MSSERELDPDSAGAEHLNPSSYEVYVPLVNERREASRFERNEGMDVGIIWRQNGEEYFVEVHDESVTGLGILTEDTLDLQIGSVVHVSYAGEYLEAEVRHITQQSDQKYLIGLITRPNLPEQAE